MKSDFRNDRQRVGVPHSARSENAARRKKSMAAGSANYSPHVTNWISSNPDMGMPISKT